MDDKPEPVRFPVVVEVNRVKVEVVLLLKPGTAVSVERTKVTAEPAGAGPRAVTRASSCEANARPRYRLSTNPHGSVDVAAS